MCPLWSLRPHAVAATEVAVASASAGDMPPATRSVTARGRMPCGLPGLIRDPPAVRHDWRRRVTTISRKLAGGSGPGGGVPSESWTAETIGGARLTVNALSPVIAGCAAPAVQRAAAPDRPLRRRIGHLGGNGGCRSHLMRTARLGGEYGCPYGRRDGPRRRRDLAVRGAPALTKLQGGTA